MYMSSFSHYYLVINIGCLPLFLTGSHQSGVTLNSTIDCIILDFLITQSHPDGSNIASFSKNEEPVTLNALTLYFLRVLISVSFMGLI